MRNPSRPSRSFWKAAPASLLAAVLLGGVVPAHAAGKGTIAVIVPTLQITVLQTESQAAVAAAKALGYNAIVLTHDFNTAKELNDAEEIIAEKVVGAVWNVADPAASAVAVQKVRAAGIPVINMDRVLTQPQIANYSVESNNFQCGALAAQAFVADAGTKGTYAEIAGPPHDAMAATRSAGYHSVLDKTGLKMVAQQSAPYDRTRGFELAGSILQAHPDILGFITGNDSIGLGAAAAIKAQGGKNMTVVGIDGGADAVAALKTGNSAFRATAAQPVADIGTVAVKTLNIVLTGQKYDQGKVELLPCTLMK
ncbi:MAG TPA: substrate-binding domain-containing protein [Acetobacteraceae bacterium]|nr:substrate-binding domain-containing protein [Acetobacteraceae bacterium]